MGDIAHQWGGDLAFGPTGDLRVASQGVMTEQRILRRLLTSAGGYIWNIQYGAGLGGFVGSAVDARRLQALIFHQLRLEPAVSTQLEPSVAVRSAAVDENRTLFVDIRFQNAFTAREQVLSVPVRP